MPPRQRPPDRHSGDRHVLPRGCPEAPSELLRIPQSHIAIWALCRRLLSRGNTLVSNAEVIRWLLESAHPRIEEMRIAEIAREAERVAAVERGAADAAEEDDQEVRWTLGVFNEAPRADPSQAPKVEPSHGRVQDSQPLGDIVQDSQAPQPVPCIP
ncbi:hypothetical protein R1sor_003958 [Riccia sorocarpa]|uniref:Uncharacterized protein n=1 Tax=Riccia sorocarpa TaxID=122646 RepID=A0ABD3H599_9MARC